jgi:hypothetical protein
MWPSMVLLGLGAAASWHGRANADFSCRAINRTAAGAHDSRAQRRGNTTMCSVIARAVEKHCDDPGERPIAGRSTAMHQEPHPTPKDAPAASLAIGDRPPARVRNKRCPTSIEQNAEWNVRRRRRRGSSFPGRMAVSRLRRGTAARRVSASTSVPRTGPRGRHAARTNPPTRPASTAVAVALQAHPTRPCRASAGRSRAPRGGDVPAMTNRLVVGAGRVHGGTQAARPERRARRGMPLDEVTGRGRCCRSARGPSPQRAPAPREPPRARPHSTTRRLHRLRPGGRVVLAATRPPSASKDQCAPGSAVVVDAGAGRLLHTPAGRDTPGGPSSSEQGRGS